MNGFNVGDLVVVRGRGFAHLASIKAIVEDKIYIDDSYDDERNFDSSPCSNRYSLEGKELDARNKIVRTNARYLEIPSEEELEKLQNPISFSLEEISDFINSI